MEAEAGVEATAAAAVQRGGGGGGGTHLPHDHSAHAATGRTAAAGRILAYPAQDRTHRHQDGRPQAGDPDSARSGDRAELALEKARYTVNASGPRAFWEQRAATRTSRSHA